MFCEDDCIAVGCLDGRIREYSASKQTLIRVIPTLQDSWVADLAARGQGIVVASDQVAIYDAVTGEMVRAMQVVPSLSSSSSSPSFPSSSHLSWLCVAVSPDGSRIAGGAEDSSLVVWDGDTGNTVMVLPGHTGAVNSLAFSPQGGGLVSGGADSLVRLWSLEQGGGRLDKSLTSHTDRVNAVSIDPPSLHVLSASDDSSICIWSYASGDLLHRVMHGANSSPVLSAGFCHCGKHFASGSEDKTVCLFSTQLASPPPPLGPLLRGQFTRIHSAVPTGDWKQGWDGENDLLPSIYWGEYQ